MTDAPLPPPDPGERLPVSDTDAVLAETETAVDEVALEAEMDVLDQPRRLLLVHAHPDDETIGTGATMARYAAEGAQVSLVTCTLGEEGEVLVPELAHLASSAEDGLGQHRIGELAAAMEALRVSDHRWLGGPGRWRDSGMMGTESNTHPGCFWQADTEQATRELVAVIREVRPQVVISYDADGGYGHPDHIQAHRITVAAFEAAADPAYAPELGEPWQAAKLYWTAIPTSVLWAGVQVMAEQGHTLFEGVERIEDLPMGVPDEQVSTEIDARNHLAAKIAAMRAYPTQIAVDGPFFALSNNIGQQAFGIEHYILARGRPGPADGPNGRESDLFAGIDL